MPRVCEPGDVVVEVVDVDPELATVHVDEGDEQGALDFKQKERAVAVLTQFVVVVSAELHNLSLCETEAVWVAERSKEITERAVSPHLVDVGHHLVGVFAWNVCVPVSEVRVEVASENILRFGDCHTVPCGSEGGGCEVVEVGPSFLQNFL